MKRTEREPLPLLGRFVVVTAIGVGLIGAVVGFVVGLFVYPRTAVFAAVEIAVPALLLGAVLSLVVGAAFPSARRFTPSWGVFGPESGQLTPQSGVTPPV
ncbi:hypothetical protein SAMN05892883_1441 [Jatrophihabitans sp. GAS493]|uniref:hypothetical protein n=1 Tax=Jatrophihabitans sp. GAS493 TaxID=1907575 RepID=UPI000BC0701B|nr:hypothetical protein [Jatrophihabitans sp. GAS493]SOD71987.1 hypothetical protein SAMN05892883_1441 [Jatrophihabitans sp. GAS493]